MAKVEVTEYETVEINEERYECDECKAVVGESDMTTVLYIEGEPSETARVSDNTVLVKHLCEGCTGLKHALKVREKKEYLKARWKGWKVYTLNSTALALPIFGFAFGGLSMILAGAIKSTGDKGTLIGEVSLAAILVALCLAIWTVTILMVVDNGE